MSDNQPHLFAPVMDGDNPCYDECRFCGLPDLNKVHNARPVRVNPRTRREEYVNPETGARSSFIRLKPKVES